MTSKVMSKGFKITATVIISTVLIIAAAAAILVYQQGVQARAEEQKSKARIAALTSANLAKLKAARPKENPKAKDPRYKGWQTYDNRKYSLSVLVPPGWTYTETSGSLHLSILGPATAGGAIKHVCAFGVVVEDVSPGTTIEAYSDDAMRKRPGENAPLEDGKATVSGNSGRRVVDTYQESGYPWKRLCVWTIKNNKAYTFDFQASTNYESKDYYSEGLATAELILESIVID